MNITFSYLVTTFFRSHLGTELGLSANTIASYSDCMKLLIHYACERFRCQPEAIDLNSITRELVTVFLNHLEQQRGNGPNSRNQRLAAIKTFFHFIAGHVPEIALANERIQDIRLKGTEHLPPPSLTVDEVAAIIGSTDPRTSIGVRDRALLQLLYNTGARVQELADLTLADLRAGSVPTVTLTGKGRKTRTIPLWQETVELINQYVDRRNQEGIATEHLFCNARGEALTRFGIGRRVALHASLAASRCPSLQGRDVSPHTFRHTTALHLIEAGNDIAVVKDWLGHADIKTTSLYLEISIERKRKALEKVPPPLGDIPPETPQWKQPELLTFLTRCSRQARYVA
jgi:site-specific recombinase XerD